MPDPKMVRLIETSQTLIHWLEAKANNWISWSLDKTTFSAWSKETGEKALTEARYHYAQAVYEAKKEAVK